MDLAGKTGALSIIFFYLSGTTECINNYSTYFKTEINVVAGNRINVCCHLSHPLSSVPTKLALEILLKIDVLNQKTSVNSISAFKKS